MIKVVVVDDEMHIREGISKFINKNVEGFVAERSFCDGDEVIAYLAENDTDIVISDIRMSRVSGIEVARYIYENKPYIKMIMLSGYRDFEYAQSAISYGIKAYILKPTDFDELCMHLNICREQIEKERDYLDNFMDSAKNVFALVVQADVDGGVKLAEEIFESVANKDYRYMQSYIKSFFEILQDKILANLKIDLSARGVDIGKISACKTRNELHGCTAELIGGIFGLVKKSDNNENTILNSAKKYIDEHFSESLSLQDVADFVYLNPIYFSRFFKIHTGQNFSEYLLDKRMTKAAELINTNMKIADVSEACGYSNMGYFSRAFKEYYKCTPKEYGRKMNGEV